MLAVLVLGLVDGFDDVGILLGIFTNDSSRPVGRRIVMHNRLKREVRLLHHEAVQTLPQKRLMIIDQTTD